MVDFIPHKEEKFRTRLTVGGNIIIYPSEVSSPTEKMSTVKVLWNRIISTSKERFCTMDISNFYLGTKIERSGFMSLPLNLIPDKFVKQYNLENIS